MTYTNYRGTLTRKRILRALIGSSVVLLSSQNLLWRTLNPFQSGADGSDEHGMSAPQHRVRDARQQRRRPEAARHLGSPVRHRANESFCLGWNKEDALNRTLQPFDTWWTHHPTWIVADETDEMFCVEKADEESDMMRNFTAFHRTQFGSGCGRIHWRMMWSSGWGADMLNVQCGLVESTKNLHIPLVMGTSLPWDRHSDRYFWHYAANKDDGSNKMCPQADMTCYFLPYHDCGKLEEIERNESVEFVENEELGDEGELYTEMGRFANAFLTRQQLWLRRAVYDFKQQFKSQYAPESDCTAIHVRRSDVVLHDQFSRKYFPVTDYVRLIPRERLKNENHTIFLLTDDANAIAEAEEFHPELRWKYIDRPRYKGTSGGWEHQTPSNNPASEVITLLAIFELVQECSMLVHGTSKFSDMLWHYMVSKRGEDHAIRRTVDENVDVYSIENEASEVELMKRLNAMRGGNAASGGVSSKLPSNSRGTTKGLIVVNVLGLLANDLFEAAFAARMAEQLGWHVIYRTMWNPAFPTLQTDHCFPNVARKKLNSTRRYGENDPIWQFLLENDDGESRDLRRVYDALTYNDLEPAKRSVVDDQDEANEVHLDWIKRLGEKAVRVEHMAYPLDGYHVDTLVESLRDPNSPVRVLQLEAFFIHFDWMKDWMGPQHIPHWLQLRKTGACCPTPPPNRDTIVIHIRDFEPEDDDKNKNLQVGVFRDIIRKYYNTSNEVWVVCQPKSVNSDIVRGLVKEMGAKIRTGRDNIDAFCILSRALIHIPSTSSSFSQLAALLAEERAKEMYGNESRVEVHYPTHTLEDPMVTLKVPAWKYHLTNEECDRIADFDVDHERLLVTQA